ncbi:MAG: hypothetical protein ACRDZP_02365, partial [Acidimicrobiales bacterium]
GRPRRLVLKISYEPGFHVTMNGRALRVSRYDDLEMSVDVPGGSRGTVAVTYWPAAFTEGLIAAGAAAVLLAGWCAWPLVGRRRD